MLESERRVREAGVGAAAAAPLYTQMKPACSGLDFGGRMIGRFASKLRSKKLYLIKKNADATRAAGGCGRSETAGSVILNDNGCPGPPTVPCPLHNPPKPSTPGPCLSFFFSSTGCFKKLENCPLASLMAQQHRQSRTRTLTRRAHSRLGRKGRSHAHSCSAGSFIKESKIISLRCLGSLENA